MPYYRFVGINLCGEIVRGKRFARSREQLDAMLFANDIALLRARQLSSLLRTKISLKQRAQLFRHVATMLVAGVRVCDALIIVAASLPTQLQKIVYDISHALQEGSSLHKALSYHDELASPHLIALLAAGEDSGQLAYSFERIAVYEESLHEINLKMRRAVMMPLISGGFFIFMTLLCVIVIVPRFQHLFETLGKPLPWSTSLIFSVNDWLRSASFLWLVIVILILFSTLPLIRKHPNCRLWYDKIMLQLPFIGTIIQHRDTMLFLQTLAVLLGGGVHLAQALGPASAAISNTTMRRQCALITQEVIAGKLLSELLVKIPGMHGQELCGLVAIGEASGTLARMIQQASLLYQERLYYYLELMTTVIQPLLLVLMGIFVALLIMVIYTPLLSLSHALF